MIIDNPEKPDTPNSPPTPGNPDTPAMPGVEVPQIDEPKIPDLSPAKARR